MPKTHVEELFIPITPRPYKRDDLKVKASINATVTELLSMFGMPITERSVHTDKLTHLEWDVSFLNIVIQPFYLQFSMDDYGNNFTTKYDWLVCVKPDDYEATDDLRKFLNFVRKLGNKDHSITGTAATTVSVKDLDETFEK